MDDKTTIRLKCLELANHSGKDAMSVVARAKEFEEYIVQIDEDKQEDKRSPGRPKKQ